MKLTINEFIKLNSSKYPNKPAVIFEDTQYTYTEVEERSNRIANRLLNAGIKKGDRCAILFYNRAEWLEVYHSLAKTGIIAVPINFRFTAKEAIYVLQNSGSRVLIYEEAFKHIVDEIKKELPEIENYVCLGDSHCDIEYEDWINQSSPIQPLSNVGEEMPFFFGYTSGTTGFPKGAVIAHRDLILHFFAAAKELDAINHNDKFLVTMPLFHSNSTWFLLMAAVMGATCVIVPSTGFNAEEFLEKIDKHRITFTSVVPTMLTIVLNLPENVKQKFDVLSLRILLTSSAPLLTKTKERTVKFFPKVVLYEGYGSTESGFVTLLRPEHQLSKKRSVGKVIIGKEIRLLDDKGIDVPIGEIGELYVRGMGVLLREYWQNEEATKDSYIGEWLTVGDMARMDEDGYIYLEDRKKEMIISGGENVFPTEVENVIIMHPSVSEVAVVGLPDDLWGERVHAVIALRRGEHINKKEIIDFCSDKLANYKRPKSVSFMESLPKNTTGKIVRRQVKEMVIGTNYTSSSSKC